MQFFFSMITVPKFGYGLIKDVFVLLMSLFANFDEIIFDYSPYILVEKKANIWFYCFGYLNDYLPRVDDEYVANPDLSDITFYTARHNLSVHPIAG